LASVVAEGLRDSWNNFAFPPRFRGLRGKVLGAGDRRCAN